MQAEQAIPATRKFAKQQRRLKAPTKTKGIK